MRVSRLLKNLRKKRGLKQNELASLISVSPQYLSSIEKNHASISAKTIASLSDKLSLESSKIINAQVKDYKLNLENDVLKFLKNK